MPDETSPEALAVLWRDPAPTRRAGGLSRARIVAAAIVLAQAGLRVVVHETAPALGGTARSEELTLPGFVHDIGSAVHPMAVASPFFKMLPLGRFGLQWIEPPAMVAHPFDDGTAAVSYRSLDRTAREQIERHEPTGRDRFLALLAEVRIVAGD